MATIKYWIKTLKETIDKYGYWSVEVIELNELILKDKGYDKRDMINGLAKKL